MNKVAQILFEKKSVSCTSGYSPKWQENTSYDIP